MASSNLLGPYELTSNKVDAVVADKSIGAYALGTVKNGVFYIYYVGRSDQDLNKRLKQHVGNYDDFKFEYYDSAKAAFEKECHLYHDFKPRDNDIHPRRPTGSNWKCPVCEHY